MLCTLGSRNTLEAELAPLVDDPSLLARLRVDDLDKINERRRHDLPKAFADWIAREKLQEKLACRCENDALAALSLILDGSLVETLEQDTARSWYTRRETLKLFDDLYETTLALADFLRPMAASFGNTISIVQIPAAARTACRTTMAKSMLRLLRHLGLPYGSVDVAWATLHLLTRFGLGDTPDDAASTTTANELVQVLELELAKPELA